MTFHRYGLAIVDPAHPIYRPFMVQQTKKQVQMTPSMVGVALDEQQYLGYEGPSMFATPELTLENHDVFPPML